jgi:hypothetical protein
VHALGALTGNMAVQQVRAGLKAIYLSGWQVAADANTAGQMYPDQSLYPADSVPNVVRRINQALLRADQIEQAEGADSRYWMAPIVADAEAGFGGPLNAFELMKAMIEAGAAGVHFEDQLASEKKCVALTFDDLPAAGTRNPDEDRSLSTPDIRAMNESMVSTLKRHHAPAIGVCRRIRARNREGRGVHRPIDARCGEAAGLLPIPI